MSGTIFVIRHVAELAIFASAAFFWGRLAGRALPFRDGFEQAVVSCALGVGVLASLLNLLGLAGAITQPGVAAVIGAPILARLLAPGLFERLPLSVDRASRIGLVALLPTVLLSLALALYPPTAFDATLYHLPIAKAFARQHGIVFLPDLRFPVFPQLFEMLYAGALTLSDDVTAQLLHVFALAVVSAGLIAWGRRFATGRAGLWAAAAWLGNPLALVVASVAMVDVGLALFCTLAIYAWEAERDTGDARWLTASAAFAGLAASTKYLGLFFVAALAAATVFTGRPGGRFRRAARFLAAAVIVLLPFYWRIVSWTGNPVFPYLSSWFGVSPWSQWLDPLPASAARTGWHGATLPGAALWEGPILSPLALLLLPFLVWWATKDRLARFVLALSLAYLACWCLASPDKRFLLAIVPACSAGAASGLDAFFRRWTGAGRPARAGLAAALALLLCSPGAAWTARLLHRRGPLPVTARERDAYLTRFLPVYPALQILNRSLGSRYAVYVLFRENAAYFADGRFLGDHFGPNRFSRVTEELSDPQRLLGVLRGMGVTHLLVDRTSESGQKILLAPLATTFHPLPSPPGTALFTLPPP